MYRPPEDGGGDNGGNAGREQVSLEDLIGRFKGGLPPLGFLGGGGFSLIVLIGMIVAAVIWVASGIFTVDPDEQAALRLFGKFDSTAGSGLNWWWPAPVGQRDIIQVTQTRTLELGFRSGSEGVSSVVQVPGEAQMITGDENIVDVGAVIQYRITDIGNYLFNVDDPGDPDRGVSSGRPDGRTLRDVAETALRQVIGSRTIDDALTEGREQIQEDTRLQMQNLLNFYRSGINVISVLLQNVNPPEEVRDAFEDVVVAQEEKERLRNLADAYEADQLPRALGEAKRITEAAEGFKAGRIALATGEAEGFKSLLEGYLNSKDITRQRLYLEAMEEILPGTTKFVVTGEVADGVLPFLPLSSSGSTGVGGGQ
ncbi:MAG: FtsH protease activity modulator HflK [Chloroflexi bacterium]|nr:FtsH protease activity modulator HflK [Chloroflexota bacterium]MBT4073221.1 FtsH protease activity modulator HflK [Chloroflexota bacterium]MBT4514416.1 FtsH protease activity modulator HflK [Chloroflexota bacterium]MBT5319068.1 FtsH protease activity modulator HflK [Chloroflexota bacterium]MBT6681818.1 FtsH protease activity modulator HflK [Chloroflexota bacterium]